MARGRPSLPPEQKARRKEERDAAKAGHPSDAILRFPEDAEKLSEEFIVKPIDLAAGVKEATAEPKALLQSHIGRVKSLYGAEGYVVNVIAAIAKMDEPRRSKVVRQIRYLLGKLTIEAQPELPLYQPGEVASDQGPAFDTTATGERHDAERKDDPARARKPRAPKAEPAAAVGGIPLSEAEAAFKSTAHLAPAGEEDPRPRFLKQREAERLEGADAPGTYSIQ